MPSRFEASTTSRSGSLDRIVRAHRPIRLPVVLSREEVSRLLSHLRGPVWLMASLMYGAGLRLLECAELRVKDINFDCTRTCCNQGGEAYEALWISSAAGPRGGELR